MALFKRSTQVAPRPAPAPVSGSIASRMGAAGSDMVGRATKIYKDNPKTVGGIALIASALLLNRLKARPR
jgi:hypothetical protein